MQKRTFNNTDLFVSVIGLGTVKFGRNQGVKYPTSFELPTDKEIDTLLKSAWDLGINLLDTAPAYGTSEERLGHCLENRSQWILCTKVGEEFIKDQSHFDFSAKHTRLSIERSLKRLRTDYLDIVLIHSNGDDLAILKQEELLDCLQSLKKQGLIRSYGMSTKTLEGGLEALEQTDLAMVTYNPSQTQEKPVIEKAQQLNKGIFIKKALASGHIDKLSDKNPIQHAFDFIFQEPGVTSVILGTLNPKHLKENVECAKQALDLSHSE